MKPTRTLLAAALAALAAAASAQTTVTGAWVRATVPNQQATAMYGSLRSAAGGRIVEVRSPVAKVAEIHEMKMEGTTMTMAAVKGGLALPPGKPVELKPGGLHLMLMELTQQLKAGEKVPLTLVVEGAGGKRETVEVQAEVRPLAGGAPAGHKGH